MRDYPINHEALHEFSQKLPYGLSPARQSFLNKLDQIKSEKNFPAITNDVGSFLQLFLRGRNIKNIFEFGSGYGHSLFWYCELNGTQKIVLTEKRDDLQELFESLEWPEEIKSITEYYHGDAFERFRSDQANYDFILIDGVKATYQEFLSLAISRVAVGGIIAIDNSYWRGSFLDPAYKDMKSAAAIGLLHQYISELENFESIFIPFIDGLSLLYRKS